MAARNSTRTYTGDHWSSRLIIVPFKTINKNPLGRAPPQLHRLLFDIQYYVSKIAYKRGNCLHIADLPSQDCETNESADACTQDFEVIAILPRTEDTFRELRTTVEQNEALHSVMQAVEGGWPPTTRMTEAQKLFSPVRDKQSTYESLLSQGDRIVIPNIWKYTSHESSTLWTSRNKQRPQAHARYCVLVRRVGRHLEFHLDMLHLPIITPRHLRNHSS